MSTVIAFLLVIGPLIFIHELGHFLVAKWRGVRVERFSLGFPPRLFGIKRGHTDYCVSAVPLGGYVKMAGDNPEEELSGSEHEYLSKAPGSRSLIIAAGPVMNYVLAFALYVIILMFGGELVPLDSGLRVGELTPDGVALAAGMESGDLIVSIDGEPLQDFEALRSYVSQRADQPLAVSAVRGADTLLFELVPALTTDPQSGAEEGKIGIYPQMTFESVGVMAAISGGARATWQNTVMVARFFGRFVTGQESPRNIGGPLFIASIAGQVAEQGWRYFLGFMAILSLNLAILNILPIPVLDGGQLVLVAIEKLKGRPLSMRQRITVQQVGLAFLLVLIIFVTINDIVRVLS